MSSKSRSLTISVLGDLAPSERYRHIWACAPLKVKSGSLRFWSIMSWKRSIAFGHMLLLNTNRKSYMGSPMASSDMTCGDLDKSKSRSLRIWVFGDLYVHAQSVVYQSGCHISEFLGGRVFLLSQRSLLLTYVWYSLTYVNTLIVR